VEKTSELAKRIARAVAKDFDLKPGHAIGEGDLREFMTGYLRKSNVGLSQEEEQQLFNEVAAELFDGMNIEVFE